MNIKRSVIALTTALGVGAGVLSSGSMADDTEWAGFVEQATHYRDNVGLSKFRILGQLEGLKFVGDVGPFSNVSINTVLRASYDNVYNMNSDDYGDDAGGSVMLNSLGLANIGAPTSIPVNGPGIGPAGGLGVGYFAANNILGGAVENLFGLPAGVFSGPDGVLAANSFIDNYTNNPNEGMILLGEHLHPHGSGVAFGVPVRPCDVDSRGCLNNYLDFEKNELAAPEIFSSRVDWLRELYIDATLLGEGDNEINFRLGRQQVIWGRTDLFRVLDIINPVDFSRNNIYDELEDIRIPMWMLKTDFRFGPTGAFDDLNAQIVWNFDKFRPNNIGQCGTPNVILDAGCFFRGMKNLWDNGGTVANFALFDPSNPGLGLLATNFGPQVIGLRDVHLPDWSISNTQLGLKVEGVLGDWGWSVNAMTYRSQLPSLRAGNIRVRNPFDGEVRDNWPYLIAFDMYFPRITMFGGSVDYYMQSIDTVWRIEAAYTQGEEFANTLRERLYSENDVFRFVIGADKNVFIRSINENRAFLLSAQVFGQHIMDHEKQMSAFGQAGVPDFGEVGMPDWETNFIATFLIKGWWMNDRLSPQFIMAHDFKAGATVIEPSIDWLISDNWQLIAKANIKWGGEDEKFSDCRSCNPFPPYTAGIGVPGGAPVPPEHNPVPGPFPSGAIIGVGAGDSGLGGFEPLGRFRSGPIGMAAKEDEIQLIIRYRF